MNKPIAWRNHLPALVLILAAAGVLWLGSPWPDRAFNLAGAGVLVETRAGKRYLIGADDPDCLAAALDAARGKA